MYIAEVVRETGSMCKRPVLGCWFSRCSGRSHLEACWVLDVSATRSETNTSVRINTPDICVLCSVTFQSSAEHAWVELCVLGCCPVTWLLHVAHFHPEFFLFNVAYGFGLVILIPLDFVWHSKFLVWTEFVFMVLCCRLFIS